MLDRLGTGLLFQLDFENLNIILISLKVDSKFVKPRDKKN